MLQYFALSARIKLNNTAVGMLNRNNSVKPCIVLALTEQIYIITIAGYLFNCHCRVHIALKGQAYFKAGHRPADKPVHYFLSPVRA